MRVVRSLVVAVLAFVVVAVPSVALADGRVALVVGNSTYAHIGRLARSMQRTAATRTVSGGSFADLNEDLLGDETLVAYAAAAGTTAADGRGRNSPYTAALLSHLETPLEIGLLFRRVRAQVLAATNGGQRPHEYHSLVGEHYLTRTLATGASVTVTAAVPADPAPADAPRPDPPETDITELHIAALRELAEAGDAEAQTELGERYEDGRGLVQDYDVAVSWFRRAAEQGYAPGQGCPWLHVRERSRGSRDDAEAVRWHRRAAEQDNARAQNNLGVSYRNGLGVVQDYGEAARWFRRAAEQGHAGGQNNSADVSLMFHRTSNDRWRSPVLAAEAASRTASTRFASASFIGSRRSFW